MHLNALRQARVRQDTDLSPFDRRLERASPRPIAVALSGGADSLLALQLTLAWAREAGRPVLALIVDHGLQPQSAEWTAFAAKTARTLGAEARCLSWRGPYPAAGLPAAARAARHGLLAEAAREAGASVIVTGHTASDARENAALGQGRLAEWSPSPVWPQGRGIFLLRPLLSLSRDEVRRWLAGQGASWIDDPANSDARYPRVRARQALASVPAEPPVFYGAPSTLAAHARFESGAIVLPREPFRAASLAERRRVACAAVVCAGGGSAIPRTVAIDRLCEALAAPGTRSATLAGARVQAAGDQIVFVRNAGEFTRRPLAPLAAQAGVTTVWDGRYAIRTSAVGEVVALRGRAGLLPDRERRALKAWPAAVRPGLPLIVRQDGTATCPILALEPTNEARWLVPARFEAACGLIAREVQL